MAKKTNVWSKAYSTASLVDRVEISMVQYDTKYILFSDGVTGLYAWNGTLEDPVPVKDYVPFLPDNYGSSSTSVQANQCPNMPAGKFLTMHRGRVFFANPIDSTVYYCGTRTDLDLNDGSVGPPAVADTPIRPWQLWNIGMDLSRHNVGSGGSATVGSNTEQIRGMKSTESGLIIFKDKSIYMWDWPDSAAPHEVSQGASIRKISDGLGAVYNTAIDQVGELVVFLGKDSFGSYGIYTLAGGSIQEISISIKQKLQSIETAFKKPRLAIVGTQMLLAYDNGDGECSVRQMFDMPRGAWVDFTSPRITCMSPSQTAETLLLGTDEGIVLAYPSSQCQDIDIDKPTASAPIPFLVRSRYVDTENITRDKKFRKGWVVVDNTSPCSINSTLMFNNEDPVEPIKIPASGADEGDPTYGWQFAFDDTDTLPAGLNEIEIPTTERAKNVQLEVCGDTDSELSVHTLQVGWRKREEK